MNHVSAAPRVPPSAAQPLFILAMDQRDSFGQSHFGVTGTPTSEQLASMRSAKSLIFAGAERVIGTPPAGSRLGILVDEQLGADVARRARQAGFELAMPVEVSGASRLSFEYGDDFPAHIEAFDPDWVKVLVRSNPADPAELRQAQTATLKRLSDWTASHQRQWLVELLVPLHPPLLLGRLRAAARRSGAHREFTYAHPRLTPDREAIIRKSASAADPRGTMLPAWMVQTLLAEVDALRSGA